jgi:hypothetical protein
VHVNETAHCWQTKGFVAWFELFTGRNFLPFRFHPGHNKHVDPCHLMIDSQNKECGMLGGLMRTIVLQRSRTRNEGRGERGGVMVWVFFKKFV